MDTLDRIYKTLEFCEQENEHKNKTALEILLKVVESTASITDDAKRIEASCCTGTNAASVLSQINLKSLTSGEKWKTRCTMNLFGSSLTRIRMNSGMQNTE